MLFKLMMRSVMAKLLAIDGVTKITAISND